MAHGDLFAWRGGSAAGGLVRGGLTIMRLTPQEMKRHGFDTKGYRKVSQLTFTPQSTVEEPDSPSWFSISPWHPEHGFFVDRRPGVASVGTIVEVKPSDNAPPRSKKEQVRDAIAAFMNENMETTMDRKAIIAGLDWPSLGTAADVAYENKRRKVATAFTDEKGEAILKAGAKLGDRDVTLVHRCENGVKATIELVVPEPEEKDMGPSDGEAFK
jgi:hypothetical protein